MSENQPVKTDTGSSPVSLGNMSETNRKIQILSARFKYNADISFSELCRSVKNICMHSAALFIAAPTFPISPFPFVCFFGVCVTEGVFEPFEHICSFLLPVLVNPASPGVGSALFVVRRASGIFVYEKSTVFSARCSDQLNFRSVLPFRFRA